MRTIRQSGYQTTGYPLILAEWWVNPLDPNSSVIVNEYDSFDITYEMV